MKNHRAIWLIAGAAVSLALAAFAARQMLGGRATPAEKAERDRLVAEMLDRLGRDHRARFAVTRALVEKASAYCDSPGLATAETWYARGLQRLYADSDLKGARDAFARAGRMRPEWAWPVNGLAIVQFVEGRKEEALKSFERALALEPGWSRPHGDLAILYRRAEDLKGALAEAEKAIALEPKDLVNQFNYGVVLDDLGRHAEARALYERVLAEAPEMAQAAYNLACSYGRDGDAAMAIPLLKRAIAADAAFVKDAIEDDDFNPIRNNAAFQSLVKPRP